MSKARLASLLFLVNGVLLVVNANRYVELRDQWLVYRMAVSVLNSRPSGSIAFKEPPDKGAFRLFGAPPINIIQGSDTRNPRHHLPLRGMSGFDGDLADACMRLEGFLMDTNALIAQSGGSVPSFSTVRNVVDSGDCSVESDAVHAVLIDLEREWHSHKLVDSIGPWPLGKE